MEGAQRAPFGETLATLRTRAGLSQQQLADQLGKTRRAVAAWEAGEYLPKAKGDVLSMARILKLDEGETMILLTTAGMDPVLPLWNVPYRRNPFFTGREHVLNRLHEHLTLAKTAALIQPPAITGLGGIGKTQIALEFAYQYHQDYQAVFWTLADMDESLVSGYVAIARLLNLPEKYEQDQSITVQAVKRWFTTHTEWLLILDNADDLTLIYKFLPLRFGGHLLLTTRAQATGPQVLSIEVGTMPQEVGALFLLRRAKLLIPNAELTDAPAIDVLVAKEICQELGGLPLALDQAGAYIEETQCTLSNYLELYHKRKAILLKRRGGLVEDHLESVATTWSLAFQKVEQKSPVAVDLLRLCAFLHPDAIPEEIITEGAKHLGPHLHSISTDLFAFDEAITALLAYSLIRRNTDKTLSIHRLVQAVIKDVLKKRTYKLWAARAVRAVGARFPSTEFSNWDRCARLLPHVQTLAALIVDENMSFPDVVYLLSGAGYYLKERAYYMEAEQLLQQALAISQQAWGPADSYTATCFNNLALLYFHQRKYAEAEQLFQRALAIREQATGPMRRYTAHSLEDLAMLYYWQGKYDEAEPLYSRALAIQEEILGSDHPDICNPITGLANVYESQSKYTEAEPLYQRTLTIFEQALGLMHPWTATSLCNLGALYYRQGRYDDAESFLQRALAVYEQTLGSTHPDTANCLSWLARLSEQQGKYAEAELLHQRTLSSYEQQLGHDHPDTQIARTNYAKFLQSVGRDLEARKLEEQF